MRAYSFKELALAYFPDRDAIAASKQLKSWITNIPDLEDSLVAAGHYKNQKIFPPRLISIVTEYLGEPEAWANERQLAEKQAAEKSQRDNNRKF